MQHPESFFFLLVVLVIAGMLVALLTSTRFQLRRQVLERIARRFRGRLDPGDWFNLPQVRFQFLNYPALLRYTKVGKNNYYTHFSITWPDAGLRCEVYPQGILSGIRKLWGMEDIEIGSPQFDSAYFICGNSRAAVRDLLSSEVQAIIFRLAGLSGGLNVFGLTGDIQVKIAGGSLTVTKPAYLKTEESLYEFVKLSADLFVAALHTRSTGIEFVGEAQSAQLKLDTAESQCQVCGEALATGLVFCASCKTPHHRECWEYFGGCSTYACGHKQYLTKGKRPKAVRR